MKKNLLKTLLVAAALAVGTNGAWAETETLYERTSTDWTDADITEWGNTSATIDNGLKQSGTNSAWSATKELTFTENSKVTLTATVTGGNPGGRSGSYDYITIGGVSLRLYGQDRKATLAIDGTENALTSFTRGGTYTLSVTIDQASGNISYDVTGNSTGNGTATSSTALTGITVGHYKASSESYEVALNLTDIKVTEEKQEVQTAGYTINYQFEGTTVKSDNGTSVIGNTIYAQAPFTVDDQKYYFADGATTSLIVSEGENILNVAVRKANVYSYTIKSNLGATLAEGTGVEGESVTVPYPKYINNDGTLYTKAAITKEYRYTFTLNADNQQETLEYTNSNIDNVVYNSEAEDIEGLETVTYGNVAVRASNALAARATEDKVITTLPAGKYVVTAGVFSSASNPNYIIKIGVGNEIFEAPVKVVNAREVYSDEFNVLTETDVTLYAEGMSNNNALDYIYIQKTGDAQTTVSVSVGEAGLATYCPEVGVDFSGAQNIAAYKASVNGNTVTLNKVTTVAAGEGVLLRSLKNGATTEDIAIAANAEQNSGNAFTGTLQDINITDGYVLSNENGVTGFFKANPEGTLVAAGKAYLNISSAAGAHSYRIVFDDEATSISAAESTVAAEDDAIYTLGGVRVANPAKGVYIKNGKKVIIK